MTIFSGCDIVLRKGNYIVTTGIGRVATWGKCRGIVTRKEGDVVTVLWDDLKFEDKMSLSEIKLVTRKPLFDKWKKKSKFHRISLLRKRFNLSLIEARSVYRSNPAYLPKKMKKQFFEMEII